jgi:hypothetical protein
LSGRVFPGWSVRLVSANFITKKGEGREGREEGFLDSCHIASPGANPLLRELRDLRAKIEPSGGTDAADVRPNPPHLNQVSACVFHAIMTPLAR